MMVYIFDAAKRVRKILSPGSITELVHDEGAYSLSAAISMDAAVKNGEHIGFKCVDGHFRIFTVTQSENFDDAATAYITARDAIVMELMETIVEDLQQLDMQLIPAIEGLLAAAQTQSAWTVTGTQPEKVEKSRAYYTDLWTMLETYRTLYEWQIIPYYTFSGGQISGRIIELKEDKAEFRGRILRSKKDASNVYDIKTNPPITRLYVLGKATGTEDEPKNESIRDVVWSISAGDPVDKPKGQPWIEDPQAVAEYGVHTAVVQINDAQDDKDLIAKGWKHLQTVKKPTSTVTATIQDLEQVPGYENQVIRLGDLVPIRLVNATMEEARVVGIKRDYLHHWLTKLTIGDKEDTIQAQVSTLMTNATHTFERMEIFKNRFHEDEALIQLNAEMIQMNAGITEMNAQEIRANAELINLKAGKEEVTELGTIITGAMIELDGLKGEIDLKASKAELTETQNRLSQAEVRINGAEASIELKADRTTVDALGTRISQAEIKVDGANEQIDLWAGQMDEFGNRLDGAEVLIDGLNAEIKLVATEKSVQDLAERVSNAEIRMDGVEAELQLVATQKTIDELVERVEQAEVNIDGANAMIDLMATKEETNRISERLSSAEIAIDGANAAIALKASIEDLSGVENRVAQAEVDIDAANAAIRLKANQTAVNGLTTRINQAELDINAAESAISLKANQSTVNALGNRVSSAELRIDGAESKIEAKADLILLEGYVKASDLETEVLDVMENANIYSLTATSLNAYSITGGSASFDNVSADWLTMGGDTVATEDWVVEQRFATQAWVNNKNYVLTDTLPSILMSYATKNWVTEQGYLKSVPSTYATQYWVNNQGFAKTSALSAYATRDWVTGTATKGLATEAWVRENFSKASATYKPTAMERYGSVSGTSIPIRALNESGTVLLTGTVDAGDVYNSGKNGVTLSAAGWQGGSNVVSASNGKSVTVSLPTFTTSGGTSWYNNQTTVYFYTSSVSGYLASKTVDATSVYNSGYTSGNTAGKNAVTLSAAGWQGSSNVVSASNGKSVTVSLPAFSTSGGTSWSNNKTTVYFSTASVNGYLASKTVDATSVYNDGWNDCRDAASSVEVYTISQNAPGTLYIKVGDYYSSVGSSWVQVTRRYGVYTLPSAKG